MELQEEMLPADAVLLMSSVPERISDLVFGLDETRLRYRHGPAFPTLGGLIFHLLNSGSKVDGLLRRAHLDGLATADVRATIDPGPPTDDLLTESREGALQEAIEDFARVRRRTVDLLHGWGKNEWERVISDPRGGSLTLLDVCRMVTRHEMAHIAQIRNLTVLLPEPQDLGPQPRRSKSPTPPDRADARSEPVDLGPQHPPRE
jgi:DinB family protein